MIVIKKIVNNKFIQIIYILIIYIFGTFVMFKMSDYILDRNYENNFIGHIFDSFNSFLLIILILMFVVVTLGAIFNVIEILKKRK